MNRQQKKARSKRKLKKKLKGLFSGSPLYDLLRTFEKAPDQWTARYILIASAIILRSAVGLGHYLGEGQKPINGDFEAQRHWMELTISLPTSQWYFYDLQYWGLDYPPLTAFHLYILGKVGSYINPEWFAFVSSRGIENPGIKTFMRVSSIVSELVFYVPALFEIISLVGRKLSLNQMDRIIITTLIMCQPALILIDHGHFQYNSVMLGFFLHSLAELIKGNYLFASIWFITSINFKQMALYYAPCIFAFLLAKSFSNIFDLGPKWSFYKLILSGDLGRLLSLGLVVIGTNILILFPFIYSATSYADSLNILKQIFIRVFPLERGLFEDKVANFWCTANVFIKFKNIFSTDELAHISLLATFASIIPATLILAYKIVFNKDFRKKSDSAKPVVAVLYSFSATAWGFYLFSYLVHEKTVLVPLLPSTLLYLLNDRDITSITLWINNVATFSMWPLLKKESLILQYFVILFLSNWLIGAFQTCILFPKNRIWRLVTCLSYLSILAAHSVDFYYAPPPQFPDLWVIVNTTLSFGCFFIFWVWLIYRLYML